MSKDLIFKVFVNSTETSAAQNKSGNAKSPFNTGGGSWNANSNHSFAVRFRCLVCSDDRSGIEIWRIYRFRFGKHIKRDHGYS